MNNQGWECPRCHSVHAPFIVSCNCSPTTNKYVCLWDGMRETTPGSGVKIAGLVCPCPKCSPTC